MWPFDKKSTLVAQGAFQNFTDNHSHILYGVDDGVETLDDSLAILASYEAMGVREVWLTPHIQEYMPNTTEELRARFQQLQEAYDGNITLHLAAEYMLDNLFEVRFHENDLLFHSLPGETPMLLVETSYFQPPMDLWGTLSKIMSAGIRPILAHPERYMYMAEADYQRLHSMDLLLQMNLPSLLGAYGKEPKKRAERLLSQGYYHLYGTDIHSPRMLHAFNNVKIKEVGL